MKTLNSSALSALLVIGTLAAFAPAGFAQDTTPGIKAPDMTAAPKGAVYLCKDGKCYFSPADAKKMGYKDPMGGGKMKKVAHAPAGGMMLTPEKLKAMQDAKMGGNM